MKNALLLAALACTALPSSPLMAAEPTPFQVDQSLHHLSDEAMSALVVQLKVMESVGLPPQVLEAMKETRIVIDPGLVDKAGVFAVRRGVGVVRVRPAAFDPGRPVVLHELLHAYHFNVLKGDRPEIRQAYAQVMRDNPFPARFRSAHFLEYDREFFAVTATIYLFGDIQQPPFSCNALSKLDPGYLAFLGAQFGPRTCGGVQGQAAP